MVDRARLESVFRVKPNEGSNPSLSANCRRAFFAYSSTYYAPEALPYVRGWIEAAEGLCIKIRGRIGLRMKTDRSVEIENRYQLRFRLYFF